MAGACISQSAKKNCRGQYRGINQSNKQCAKDLQAITMLTEKINHECILEPQCRPISGAYSKMADHQKALLERSEESHIKLNSMQTSLNPKFRLGFPKFGCRHIYENLLLHVWANDVNVQKALRVHKRSYWMRCNSSSLPYRKYFQNVVSYHLSLNNRGYRALIYSGDHDMTVPYLGTLGWIRSLDLTIVDRWRPWLVDGEVTGYSIEYSNDFTFATVKGGGHTAPEYKPKECFVMFKMWISQKAL